LDQEANMTTQHTPTVTGLLALKYEKLLAEHADLLAALREIAETVDHNSKLVIKLRKIAFAAISKVEVQS
jgi:hypothetical protein